MCWGGRAGAVEKRWTLFIGARPETGLYLLQKAEGSAQQVS